MSDRAIKTEWREIPGFPGYQASDSGLVRSTRRVAPVLMRHEFDKDGYLRIQLRQDGRYVHIGVHRAVALAFHGLPPTPEHRVCHNDGSPSNNRPGNLRWGTQKENIADKVSHGTAQLGSKHGMAKADEASVSVVKRLLRDGGMTLDEIALLAGISRHIVADVSRNRTWRHVA